MAAINGALNPTHESFIFSLDPTTSLLSLNPSLERGPRYTAYAQLRESRLRMRYNQHRNHENHQELTELEEPEPAITPPRKRVTFQRSASPAPTPVSDRNGSHGRASMVAQSVPDLSAALRKENRRPVNASEMTPPLASGKGRKVGGGSKSASGGEKRVGMAARKSYASIEELRGLSSGVASAINGGGRNGRGNCKTVLGYRQC